MRRVLTRVIVSSPGRLRREVTTDRGPGRPNGRSVTSGNIGRLVCVKGSYVLGTGGVLPSYVTKYPCSVRRGKVGDIVTVQGNLITGKGDVSCPVRRRVWFLSRDPVLPGRRLPDTVRFLHLDRPEPRTECHKIRPLRPTRPRLGNGLFVVFTMTIVVDGG